MRSMLPLVVFLAIATPALAVELRDVNIVAGAATVLENAGGTVRLEHPQLDAKGRPFLVVPEPGTALLMGLGLAWLVWLVMRKL